MAEIIRLSGISKSFGGMEILRKINLTIGKGDALGIFGPSGCGKTTLLRIISGLETPDSGKVYLRGEEVNSDKVLTPPEKRNISFIFQDLALWPHMSVKEHLSFVLGGKIEESELENRIAEILGMVKLTKYSGSKPNELSGGQKQLLAIARAIAQGSDIILLDEPFSSLDLPLKNKIKNLLQKIQERNGLTLVYVTHDIFDIVDICGRVALMNSGRITRIGQPSKLLRPIISRLAGRIK
jgi:ABC-type Fe3+/spermidine/putrescine transport system ATPase subunit